MIRLGVCTKPENMALLASQGFEYIEIGLAWLHGLTEEEYKEQRKLIDASPIAVEVTNLMLPGTIRVTGPEVDEAAIHTYLDEAFRRAHEIGVKVSVFGSGGARRVPEGWSHAEAWRQIARYLTIANDYCEKYDIDIAIEPLRRVECNIMNFVTEGTLMSSLLNFKRIGTLGDTYHMRCGYEPYSAFIQAGDRLRHVHIGHTLGVDAGRIWPAPDDGENYREIFEALEAAGYNGRVSIEASCDDMAVDGAKAFAVLDQARRG